MTEGSHSEEKNSMSLWKKIKNWINKARSTPLPAGKTIGIFAVVLTVSIAVSVLVTFSATVNNRYQKESEAVYRLRLLSELIESEAYFPYDAEALMNGALNGYVGAMDDGYAVYYDREQFDRLYEEMNGVYVGIGVTIQISEIELEGKKRTAVEIVNVTKGAAAESAGLLVGDYILAVVSASGDISTDGLSSDQIVNLIRGKEGTSVTLSVLRRGENEEIIQNYTMKRVSVVAPSVSYRLSELAESVGVVEISGFDLQTPSQLVDAMDALVGQGVRKFVIDLRSNPGGDLGSVVACASYFLQVDDVILSKEYKNGDSVEYRAVKRSGNCPVSEEDIGKYRDYEYVILTNGMTASAAEILTAVFRDYSLGTLVGEKTFGKGIVQTVYPLNDFGGVKFTTSVYYPPCGVCYHDIGITPDIEVKNTDTEDRQMQTAINELNK